MGFFSKRLGHGTTLRLVTSGLTLDLKSARLVGRTREAVDVTGLSDADRSYLAGRVGDPGTLECECFFDPAIYDVAKLVEAQPYVLTLALAKGEEEAAEQSGWCFVTDPGDQTYTENEALMMSVRIRLTGPQSFKPAKLAVG